MLQVENPMSISKVVLTPDTHMNFDPHSPIKSIEGY